MTPLAIILILVFSFYTFFESMSGIARYSGFKIGAISIGVALQNQVLSLNRFIGFLIAPLVGYYADTVGYKEGILLVGVVGSLIGAASLLVGYRNWSGISSVFAALGQSFLDNGYRASSIKKAFQTKTNIQISNISGIRKNYLIAQLLTTGLAMPAVFAVNIIALSHDNYNATILQLSSVISGAGNLVLNFYTFPHLAVEENNNPEFADACYKSIFIGKIIGLGILAPLVIILAYYV